ncbi:MAG: hypothetical protein ACFCUG_10235 [Thiotrichales bacterium]
MRYRGDDHFTVIRGIGADGRVAVADPSWGNRQFTEVQFRALWETREDERLKGKILLVLPPDTAIAKSDTTFFAPPKAQSLAVEALLTGLR